MTATGLKKCRPPNLSPLFVTLAISVMERDEVLLANIVELQRDKLREAKRVEGFLNKFSNTLEQFCPVLRKGLSLCPYSQ